MLVTELYCEDIPIFSIIGVHLDVFEHKFNPPFLNQTKHNFSIQTPPPPCAVKKETKHRISRISSSPVHVSTLPYVQMFVSLVSLMATRCLRKREKDGTSATRGPARHCLVLKSWAQRRRHLWLRWLVRLRLSPIRGGYRSRNRLATARFVPLRNSGHREKPWVVIYHIWLRVFVDEHGADGSLDFP